MNLRDAIQRFRSIDEATTSSMLGLTTANTGLPFRFVPSQFPVPGQPGFGGGWRFNANANGSQVRLDYRAPSLKGDFRLYYQNEFFGDDQKHMS